MCHVQPLRNEPHVGAMQYKIIHDPPCWCTGFIPNKSRDEKGVYRFTMQRMRDMGKAPTPHTYTKNIASLLIYASYIFLEQCEL